MKRLEYWQANVKTAQMDAFARYAALAYEARSREAFNRSLLTAIGREAQRQQAQIVDSIDDDAELTAEEQEDIFDRFQEYHRIMSQVADLLNKLHTA